MEHPCASQSTKGRARGDKVQFFVCFLVFVLFFFVFPAVVFVRDCLSYFV